jgi:phage antirepressor YoqD-like protein
MNELTKGKKFMTVREVAEVLKIDPRSVQLKVKELFPEIVENGKTTYLDEAQVTTIKLNLEKKFEVKTALEKALIVQQALKIQQEEIAELQEQNAAQAKRIADMTPQVETLEKITATSDDVSVRELAAILAVPNLGQNNLFKRLQKDGFIDCFKRPYREFIERGYIYSKDVYIPALDATKQQLRITQKGVAFFARKYAIENL